MKPEYLTKKQATGIGYYGKEEAKTIVKSKGFKFVECYHMGSEVSYVYKNYKTKEVIVIEQANIYNSKWKDFGNYCVIKSA